MYKRTIKQTPVKTGTYASRPAAPQVGDLYLATDVGVMLACYVANVWTKQTAVKTGTYASKPAAPQVGDLYLATDVELMLACYVENVWTDSGIITPAGSWNMATVPLPVTAIASTGGVNFTTPGLHATGSTSYLFAKIVKPGARTLNWDILHSGGSAGQTQVHVSSDGTNYRALCSLGTNTTGSAVLAYESLVRLLLTVSASGQITLTRANFWLTG